MSSRPPADPPPEDPRDEEGESAGAAADEHLLTMVRSLFEAADPVPAGLVDRIRFSVALAGLEGEVARLAAQDTEVSQLYEHPGGLALARGGAPEESRTITFDSTDLTIMIRIDANADGTVGVPMDYLVKIRVLHSFITDDSNKGGYEDTFLMRPVSVSSSLSRREDAVQEVQLTFTQFDTFIS